MAERNSLWILAQGIGFTAPGSLKVLARLQQLNGIIDDMPKRTRSYTDGLKDRLKDTVYAVAYLNAALDDSEDKHSEEVFLLVFPICC